MRKVYLLLLLAHLYGCSSGTDEGPIVDGIVDGTEEGEDNTGGNPGNGGGGGNGNDDDGDDDGSSPPTKVVRENIVWKRVNAVRNDLKSALNLTDDNTCKELEVLDCFTDVHLAPLGGNEPFELAQYVPASQPSAITPIALERVSLAACSNRVELDAVAGANAVIFNQFDLNANALPDDATYLQALDAQNTVLFQRILARNPQPEELVLMQELTKDTQGAALTNKDVAKLSCFTIATNIEFLFI